MPAPSAIDLVVQTVRTSNALLRASRRIFKPFGLSEAQFNILHILQDSPATLSQRELSDILIVDRSNVTGLIDRMESAGWVKRLPVAGDRRAYQVSLTPPGRKLWQKVYPRYEAAAAAVITGLKPTQLSQTHRTLVSIETHAAPIGL
jgi:DNA-binding MarR family transcriptional regulator